MSRTHYSKLSFLIIYLVISSCASYDVQYGDSEDSWNKNADYTHDSIEHTFYLIGDGGQSSKEHIKSNFSTLQQELSKATKETTVLFLGDNIYEAGMPEENQPERKNAENILNAQMSIVTNFKGQTIFIPGNHDYYNDGIKGLKREADYITNKLNNKNAFLPKGGCPIKKVNISNSITLIVVDSQWFLEDWNKNPTMNNGCEIKTREGFFDEFESIIKKNENKTVLISLHHPLFSNGSHGGQFSWNQQLYPMENKVPLPVVGSFINLLRKTSGASPQDLQNPYYLKFKKRIITLSQKSKKAVFISGHEHNLQFIQEDNKPQIISGSGSKTSPARVIGGSEFSYGGLGYAKIEVLKNGASWVTFYNEKDGERTLLFKREIFTRDPILSDYKFSSSIPKTVKASIYSKEETDKNNFFKGFWGEHYRKYFSTEVEVPTVNIDTLFGGLTPIRKGGGHQSRSLRLVNKEGKEYVMRAMRKSATQYFQEVAFKDQYVDKQFQDTYTEELLLDIYTIAHPYATFTNAILSDAIDLYHTNPKLYYVPKQKGLKQYNDNYGDELYMIEERPSSGHGDVKSFGYSNKIINTEDFLNSLRKSDNNTLDEGNYIRARLYDMVIGDWDRHEDQWRWAEFKKGKKKIYRPVPRDRDQAFSSADGFALRTAAFLSRDLRLMQVYKEEMTSVKWFNLEPFPLDITLINHVDIAEWIKQAEFIQSHLTDDVINKAFMQLPVEVQGETITEIKKIFKGRINNLKQIAEEYYNDIHKYAILKGTDKDNWFDIERLKYGKTIVDIYNIKNNVKGKKIVSKTFSDDITKEIWIYGLDEDDVFNVKGNEKSKIRLRIIGGQNHDTYNIENGKKLTIYDYKSKNNTFTNKKGKIKLTDDYELNLHAYKRLRYERNQILPLIGANPDDGFRIGIQNKYTKYGFNGNPFTQQYTIGLNYYFATSGYDAKFNLEIGNVFHDWNFYLESRLTSPNYSINFFGYGNNTINLDEELGVDYNRVKIGSISAKPALKWTGRMGGEFRGGVSIESVNVDKTPDRYIGTLPEVSDQQQDYVGINTSYSYENYDNYALRTLGMKSALSIGWKSNIDNKTENNAYITPELSFNHKLDNSEKIILATKLKGNLIIGDNFEFYNAASIGGKDGLRGYRNQRFTGNKSFYQNTDLRINFQHVKTRILPLNLGILAGFDYGRVWLNGEDSNDWKTSYGGGFWIVAAEMINFNLYAFNSDEGTYVRFGLGFGF